MSRLPFTAMNLPICHHCACPNVQWFTPSARRQLGAVLLCAACHRLTVLLPGGTPGKGCVAGGAVPWSAVGPVRAVGRGN